MADGYHAINTVRVGEPTPNTTTPEAARRALLISRSCALVCVLIAIVDWVALAELIQKLQQPDKHGKSWNKPFFLCFCIRTTYLIAFIPYALWKYTALGGEGRRDPEPFSQHYMFTRACILNTMGYVSGYTWYMSLPITSVSANTAIYMCACAAVFLISIPVLREKITVIKVLSLLVCCTGIVLVSLFSTTKPEHIKPHNSTSYGDNTTDLMTDVSLEVGGEQGRGSILGYVLVLLSMFMYASYEVFYGYLMKTDQDKHPVLTSLKFIGWLGLTTPLLFGALLPVWHYTGWETIELPADDKIGLFFLCLGLDALFNIFLLLTIVLSNPTLASVGQSLALPASMLADLALYHFLMPWPALCGAFCIFLGFCGFVYGELQHDPSKSESRVECPPEDRQGLLDEEDLPPSYFDDSDSQHRSIQT